MMDLIGFRASFRMSDRLLLGVRMRDDTFGRQPEQVDVNSPTFVLTLLLQTADLRDKRRILKQHPVLLSPMMEGFMEYLAESARGVPGLAEAVNDHRLLLARCRQVGVDEAFAEWAARPPASITAPPPGFVESDQGAADDLAFTVSLFLQARTGSAKRRLLEQHPELFGSDADKLLAYWYATARTQGNEDAAGGFEAHRRLLLRCRQVGVEAAFAEQRL
jgi:hypothetical protein